MPPMLMQESPYMGGLMSRGCVIMLQVLPSYFLFILITSAGLPAVNGCILLLEECTVLCCGVDDGMRYVDKGADDADALNDDVRLGNKSSN